MIYVLETRHSKGGKIRREIHQDEKFAKKKFYGLCEMLEAVTSIEGEMNEVETNERFEFTFTHGPAKFQLRSVPKRHPYEQFSYRQEQGGKESERK